MKKACVFIKNVRKWKAVLIVCIVGSCLLTACEKSNRISGRTLIQPTGPKPAWAPDITNEMLAVIEVLDTIAPLPITSLTPQQARMQPGASDAYKRLMMNYHITPPVFNVDTAGRDIPVSGGSIHIRIYTPATGKSKYPVIVYYHGGGWVIATIDTYGESAQALADRSEAILISVEYRKGPEFKFPTAHNDAFAAYQWALANASSLNGDSSKVAVAGESAGGNLAVAVGIMARDSGAKAPVGILSVYPVADKDSATASKLKYVDAKPLGTPALPWFLMHYLPTPADVANPLISLVDADLHNLPPVTIIGAELDPLQTEGKELADKLQGAGVNTTYKLYYGVTHEFFGMSGVLPEAQDAQKLAAIQLKTYFH
jgi:acetyl esterase